MEKNSLDDRMEPESDSVGVEDIATEEEWAVYGVYMPVRGAHDTAQDVEETWSALDEMMEESELTALAEGSTHRSGTQIDNWLMTPAAAREMGACWVLPGVCGKDHDMVMVRRSEAGQEQGERRPMNSAAKAFFPESKDKAEIQKIKTYAEEAERLPKSMHGGSGGTGPEGCGAQTEEDQGREESAHR
jgi:hypothetical protein